MNEREDSRRGDLVTALQEQQQRVMAALETAEPIDAAPVIQDDEVLSGEEYVTLVYELHHVHLPELQAGGVIEFDRGEELVRRVSRFDEARSLFKRDHDR